MAPPGFEGLADALGVDAEALQEALGDFHRQKETDRRGAFASALAEALGISVDKVSSALDALEDERDRRPPMSLRRLASALDVTQAELREALREVRAGLESQREDHRAALVKFLAERFDIAEDKVDEALGDLRGPGPGPGPHGGAPPVPGDGPGFGSGPPGAGLGTSS